jgi:predicted acetyltransferase
MPDEPRRMAEADIEQAAAVQVEAFGGVLADAIERYRQGPRYTWRDTWVVETGGEIRAAAIAIPATWWFRGRSYSVSAVAGVAVRAVDRRRGLASQLMRAILAADRAVGRPFSLLYPFRHGFYRRLGYGSVGLMHFWRLPTGQLPDEPRLRSRVRPLGEEDRPRVTELFARSLRESDEGGLERNPGQWQSIWSRDDRWIVYEDDDGIGGYLAYRAAPNALELRELVAIHAQAERGIWSFIAAQVEQRASVSYHAPASKPLWAMLGEPYMFEGTQRGFVISDMASLTMSFMARGVEWATALERRDFPTQVHGRLSLELEDAVFGSQRFDLELAQGSAQVRPISAEPAIRSDVGTFSQLCCGALSPAHARWYGLLEAPDEELALLAQAFPLGPAFIHQLDWF